MRKGFNVLDRSKFEAKLRYLRDRTNSAKTYWYSNCDKRTEDELVDISEVIRAAQTGEDQADYLLQMPSMYNHLQTYVHSLYRDSVVSLYRDEDRILLLFYFHSVHILNLSLPYHKNTKYSIMCRY